MIEDDGRIPARRKFAHNGAKQHQLNDRNYCRLQQLQRHSQTNNKMPNNKKKPKKNTRNNKNEKDEMPIMRRKENTVSSSRNYIGTEEHQNITKMIQNLRRLKMSHPLPTRRLSTKLKGKPICYHGSTEDQLNDSENDYFIALAEWYNYGRRYGSENVWQKYVDDHEDFMEVLP